VEAGVKIIEEKVKMQDRKECDKIFKGTRIHILGKNTSQKQTKTEMTHTVPVLLVCQCRNKKDRLENILRKAGFLVSFQWPKESLEFVNSVRKKGEKTGYKRKAYFTLVRLTLVAGRVYIRADCINKERGKFEQLACWRIPSLDRTKWDYINGIIEPESTWAKKRNNLQKKLKLWQQTRK
jgi:hypothetical protein